MKNLMIILVLLGLLVSCQNHETTKQSPLPVIFDTDMGNDIDDALALAMLNNYMSESKLNLLGVVSSKKNIYSVEYIDILDTWYHHPGIPIGMTTKNRGPQDPGYTKKVAEMSDGGKKIFKRTLKENANITDAVPLYRKLLSKAKDTSVVIICVGFSTNLSGLLQSGADQFSQLDGKDLVRKKVKYLSMMACNFDGSIQFREFNVVNDCDAARDVFDNWPTQIIVSPFEVGMQVKYPASSILHDFNEVKYHPLAEAYKSYMKMPYDRPCRDPTAVLYVMEKDSNYFSMSGPGIVKIDTACASRFVPDREGNCRYLRLDSIQAKSVVKRLVEVVTMDK